MDRVRVWLAVSPIVAGGVLVAHALAYRLTATPTEPLHGYLDHAPQVLLVAGLIGLAVGLATHGASVAAWPFAVAAPAAFAVQEHTERLLHTGELPWLLTSPVFLLGLVLQLPVALVVWVLARRLVQALFLAPARRPRLPRHLLDVLVPSAVVGRSAPVLARPSRGPPLLRRP